VVFHDLKVVIDEPVLNYILKMSEFEQICSGLITISKDMISNNKDRAEYAKSINYQITQLF